MENIGDEASDTAELCGSIASDKIQKELGC